MEGNVEKMKIYKGLQSGEGKISRVTLISNTNTEYTNMCNNLPGSVAFHKDVLSCYGVTQTIDHRLCSTAPHYPLPINPNK